MSTQYGYRIIKTGFERWCADRETALLLGADLPGFELIAREVSEPRVVSIRA